MFRDVVMVLLPVFVGLGVRLGRPTGWVWEERIVVGSRRFGWDGISLEAGL